jgi:hypothetical protein
MLYGLWRLILVLINNITVNIDKDVVWLMETDLSFNKLHNS